MSETTVPIGLFDRAIRRIATVWRDMGSGVTDADQGFAAQMQACLSARGCEASARNRAAKLAETYLTLDEAGRTRFLRTVAEFDSDPEAVDIAYDALRAAGDPAERATATMKLRRALEAPRVRLLTQFTTIPDGMKFLVDLRATLLTRVKGDPTLTALESDLCTLLANWFDVGFLELRRIDWMSPALLLERLVGYEAVHEIRSWSDLKNRLDSDRRCYALFHPRMPNEPKDADTAIFYSISNCQRGLAGISFGNYLIKRVVEVLGREYGTLKQFATLSPIPGFRRWLDAALKASDGDLLSSDEAAALAKAIPGEAGGNQALAAILAKRGWFRDPALQKAVEPILVRLAARYLLVEGSKGRALDPVAHFHLSNGARLERILMGADTSEKGIKESATLMVNYLYDPAKTEEYHEDYAQDGKRNAPTAIRKMSKGWA